ncbi:hypothetical protein GCM10028803_46490 [Larkinella knui]|uniref:Tetratricopeptide repeat protein n=1 Tax=Larkinella knui TaxID=2025310 RepID=A0A3P1CPJ0_9BACT|nr:hypothetical protein [Larkinella knui]RRB15242.1 hypothetical protein EHT87_11920 [Larkinella knui]
MTSVLKNKVTPQNPLGIIALFVFFIEAIATVSLGLVATTPYVIYLIWFIIIYPTFIAIAFFVLLWLKREALYSPGDYRDDTTFKEILLQKVAVIEAKQDAATITSSTNIDEIIRTVDRLIALNDIYSAVNVGRTFFKEGEFEMGLKLFDYLKSKISPFHDSYYKILSNRAYSLIGIDKFQDAIDQLNELRNIHEDKFMVWHSIALAYAYYKIGNQQYYRQWLDYSRKIKEFQRGQDFFKKLYPEIADDL